MSEEVLVPKMKRMDAKDREIHIPWFNIALIFFCTLLIIASTFINLNLKHYIIPRGLFLGKTLNYEDYIYSVYFIPQIPIVMFISSFLGKRMGLSSVVFYILMGLFCAPIFALGGGPRYFLEYGFGYIIAYIPAVVIAGNLFEQKYSFKNMIKASMYGVLLIHLIGVLYMVFIAILKGMGIGFIAGWIAAQSGLKVLYDLVASFVLILIGKYLHSALKFVL